MGSEENVLAEGPGRGVGLGAVLVAFCGVVLLSCGGGGDGDVVGPLSQAQDGRVVVDNQTGYALEVAFLNETDPAAPAIVRTRVEAGERQDVSRTLLPAGTVVELDLVLLVADGEGFRVRRKAQVTVDGEVVVTVRLADPEDRYSLTTTGA